MCCYAVRMATSIVYVIGATDQRESTAVKIGTTAKLKERFATIQACSPLTLSILKTFEGGCELEYDLHLIFADRQHHNEWFDLGSDPIGTVESVIEDLATQRKLAKQRASVEFERKRTLDKTGRVEDLERALKTARTQKAKIALIRKIYNLEIEELDELPSVTDWYVNSSF